MGLWSFKANQIWATFTLHLGQLGKAGREVTVRESAAR